MLIFIVFQILLTFTKKSAEEVELYIETVNIKSDCLSPGSWYYGHEQL